MSRGQRLTMHGRDHRPGGADPTLNGPWHYVGTSGEPAFQNSWSNVGGVLQGLRFRWLVGGGTELQGSVTGGTSGTVVFSLPVGFFDPSGEIRLTAVKDDNTVVVLRIAPATGPARADVYYDEP